jgi:hypothetical protein
MEFRRIGKWLFLLTIVILVVFNQLNLYPYLRMTLGAFGIGGAVILFIIGSASPHDD